LRDGLPLLREQSQASGARPEQTPARSGTTPGYTTSWDAIRSPAHGGKSVLYP